MQSAVLARAIPSVRLSVCPVTLNDLERRNGHYFGFYVIFSVCFLCAFQAFYRKESLSSFDVRSKLRFSVN